MTDSDDTVWIAVTSDGTVTAWDTPDAARNHLRDDDGQVWVEEVTINRSQEAAGAPSAAEHAHGHMTGPTGHNGARRRSWISPPNLIYPDGPEAA